MTEQNGLVKAEPTVSERFTNLVMREFSGSVGKVDVTEAQRSLIQGYFMGCDKAIKNSEKDRVAKNEWSNNKNEVPYSWNNVIIDETLAQEIVVNAKLGLDMTVPNHVSPILFKDNKTNKYAFTFMRGYRGKELIAKKFAFQSFEDVRVELIYSSDTFKPVKKDSKHDHDDYEFEINNPFDRGTVVGGFAYVTYEDAKNNTLYMMTAKDIEKRKPKYASANFWGGMKKVKDYKTGKYSEEKIEGWYEEMCLKTISNYVYSRIALDPAKTDENYRKMLANESKAEELALATEVDENGNGEIIDVETTEPEETMHIEQQQVKQQIIETSVFKEPEPVPAQKQNSKPQDEESLGF